MNPKMGYFRRERAVLPLLQMEPSSTEIHGLPAQGYTSTAQWRSETRAPHQQFRLPSAAPLDSLLSHLPAPQVADLAGRQQEDVVGVE